jgi:hypothetical protein
LNGLGRNSRPSAAALEKAVDIYWEMVERVPMAALTDEFYQPVVVRQRAAFNDPETVTRE